MPRKLVDGDSLNTLSLKDISLAKDYELYDPRLEMVISKNDGLFDNAFNLVKDQIVSLNQFCTNSKIKVLQVLDDDSNKFVDYKEEKKKKIIKVKKLKKNEKKMHKVKIKKLIK